MKSKKGKQSAAAVVGATPSVLGPTPLSDIPSHGGARQQRRAAAQDDLVQGDTRKKQPATIKVVNFHKVPPRSRIVEKENTRDDTDITTIKFKERSKLEAAPGLGEISATIWAKTPASKGGAKDPAATVVSRAAHIAAKQAQLNGADERAALLNCDGFNAYAAEIIWGVRAPDESDDAPLDQGDPLQVRGRLREVWRSWRKLPVDKQRDWANLKLSKEMAAVMRQASGATSRKSSSSMVEPNIRSRKGGSKKLDGWRYAAPPKHADRTSTVEPKQQDQDQRPAAGKAKKKRKAAAEEVEQEEAADTEYDAVTGNVASLDDEYRRAVLLRGSKAALLAEMRCWEEDDEEKEAAAAAGMSVDDLRKHRKEAAAATAIAEQDAAAEEADEEKPAATGRGKKRKAANAGTKKDTSAAVRRSSRTTRKQQQEEEGHPDDEEMAEAKDNDEDADDGDDQEIERQEAELEKALAAADDSDEDNEASSSEEEEEEEPQEPEPPAKKAKSAAAGKASASTKVVKKPGKKKLKVGKDKPADDKAAVTKSDANSGKAAVTNSNASKQSNKISKKAKQAETKAKSAAQPQKDEAGTSAAAAASAGTSKQRTSAAAGKASQSPSRKSQRHQKEEQQEPQQVEEDDGPAVSGAGKSSGPRRGRSAGGAKAARIEYLEKSLFSNTRRSSYGRADSPGLAALAAGSKRPSRLSKNKN